MGDYTNAEDLRRLYPKVDTAGLKDNDLDWYVDKAEAEINGVLATRYSVPIVSSPPLLRHLSSELAVIYILERFFTSESGSNNEQIESRKESVMNTLKMILDGDSSILDSDNNVIAEDVGTISSTTSLYTPTFGVGNPVDEEVDPDRIEDEEDARD